MILIVQDQNLIEKEVFTDVTIVEDMIDVLAALLKTMTERVDAQPSVQSLIVMTKQGDSLKCPHKNLKPVETIEESF